MSDTRTAKPGSAFRQERYASSPEYERGFLANLVAQRCGRIAAPMDRELVWFIQYLSWTGGFGLLADALGMTRTALEMELHLICFDPTSSLTATIEILNRLRKYYAEWRASRCDRFVETAVAREVRKGLDYASRRRGLVLASGMARRGKTFAARAWCEENAGRARYVEVPPFNDAEGFFRAIARAIGVSINQNSKAKELRGRIEAALLPGDLTICLDEASRAWPQTNLRFSVPERINWIMQMSNKGVPFFLLSTPQFLEVQKQMEERSRWNAAQWNGRLEYIALPDHVALADFSRITSQELPGADADVLKAVAIYARGSQQYLAGIDSIKKRALHSAEAAGRDLLPSDVRGALAEKLRADASFYGAAEAARRRVTGPRTGRAAPAPRPGDDDAVWSRNPRASTETDLAESDSRMTSNGSVRLAT